jgi:hypothetical protein
MKKHGKRARQKATGRKMMTGKELFQTYMEQPPEHLPHFLQSLSWEDVQAMGAEMTQQAQEARAAGDTEAVLTLVSRSLPFLEYFEEK